jgi:hypothetical protein
MSMPYLQRRTEHQKAGKEGEFAGNHGDFMKDKEMNEKLFDNGVIVAT